MYNPGLIKTYLAAAAIIARRICVFDATGSILQSGAGAIGAIGVSDRAADIVIGRNGDVIRTRIAEVEYGGNVAYGDPLTSDANGKAVLAAPAVGVNVGCIGFAEVDGDDGTFGAVLISPFILTGV